jgi:hypothetical protein
MSNIFCDNGPRAASNSKKHRLSTLPHEPYFSGINLRDCWLFGISKVIRKDRAFTSVNDTEEAIQEVSDMPALNDAERLSELDGLSCLSQ